MGKIFEKQPLYRGRGKRIKEKGAGCKYHDDEEAWSPFFNRNRRYLKGNLFQEYVTYRPNSKKFSVLHF